MSSLFRSRIGLVKYFLKEEINMNKKHFLTVSAACLLGLALSSCQIAPVNATTKIDSVKGAGSKTLSA